MGLMQVIPDPYENMRQALGPGSDPYDPHNDIFAGTAFLVAMYNRLVSRTFRRAQCWPERYDAWPARHALAGGDPRLSRAIGSDVAESGLMMGAATGSGGFGNTRVAGSRPGVSPSYGR